MTAPLSAGDNREERIRGREEQRGREEVEGSRDFVRAFPFTQPSPILTSLLPSTISLSLSEHSLDPNCHPAAQFVIHRRYLSIVSWIRPDLGVVWC